MKFRDYLQEREYGQFSANLLGKYSNYAPGVTPQKRLGGGYTEKGPWKKIKDQVLAIRKKAMNNKKTSKRYVELLKIMAMRKKDPMWIKKELNKIESLLEYDINNNEAV